MGNSSYYCERNGTSHGSFFPSKDREWLLSHAVAKVVKLYLRCEEMASHAIEVSTLAGGFKAEIAFYRKRLAEV